MLVSQRIFSWVGWVSTRGRLGHDHDPPPALPMHRHPDARRLAPPSSGSVYVTNFR